MKCKYSVRSFGGVIYKLQPYEALNNSVLKLLVPGEGEEAGIYKLKILLTNRSDIKERSDYSCGQSFYKITKDIISSDLIKNKKNKKGALTFMISPLVDAESVDGTISPLSIRIRSRLALFYQASSLVFYATYYGLNIKAYGIGRAGDGRIVSLNILSVGNKKKIKNLLIPFKALNASDLVISLTLSPDVIDFVGSAIKEYLKLENLKSSRLNKIIYSQKGKILLEMVGINDKKEYIKIPFCSKAILDLQNNKNKLIMIDKFCKKNRSHPLAPKYINTLNIGMSNFATCETSVTGKPLRASEESDWDFLKVTEFLIEANSRVCLENLDKDAFVRKKISQWLSFYYSLNKEFGGALGRKGFHEMIKNLGGEHVMLGISHGDFSMSNIFIDRNGVFSVIDWDDSIFPGIPVFDIISLRISFSRKFGHAGQAYSSALYFSENDSVYLMALDKFYNAFETDISSHNIFVMIFWVLEQSKKMHNSFLDVKSEENITFINQFESLTSSGA